MREPLDVCASVVHTLLTMRNPNSPRRESVRNLIGKRVARAIETRDGCRCVYCGIPSILATQMQFDHLTPHSRGGRDVASNLVYTCRVCNRLRSTMTLTQWAAFAAATLGLSIDPRAIRAQARRSLRLAA
jgi:5-methylcytosine-specific restriction endonuclease McrA